MSRSVEQIEAAEARLKEEKKLAKAEAEFRDKKAAGKLTNADREKLREARRAFRENHRAPAPGASPAAIGASAKVEEV